MIAALYRFFFIICLAVIGAYITLHFFGSDWAIFTSVAILSIPLVYSYINLARLKKFIQTDSVENISLPSGYWEEIYFGLQRLVKGLKQKIRNIEQQHDHFIEAFQASPNGIVMLDETDQIEWCNGIAERFFGLNFKRDVMQRINFLIRRPEFVQYLVKRTFDEPLLLERMGPDSSLSLMLQAFPFGQNRHLLLVQDITDLQKADAMRRDFVANVSHEMRTPITVLMGFLETVQSLNLDKTQQDAIYAKYLGAKPPLAFYWQLEMAYDNLLTIAGRRINA